MWGERLAARVQAGVLGKRSVRMKSTPAAAGGEAGGVDLGFLESQVPSETPLLVLLGGSSLRRRSDLLMLRSMLGVGPPAPAQKSMKV